MHMESFENAVSVKPESLLSSGQKGEGIIRSRKILGLVDRQSPVGGSDAKPSLPEQEHREHQGKHQSPNDQACAF